MAQHIQQKVLPIFGLLAEFDSVDQLLAAANQVREQGFRKADAYTPFPVHGLSEALGFHRSRVPLLVLVGGIIGGLSGFLMMVYGSVWSYPINVGGRPLYSWPAFIPITFEMTVLGAALFAVLGMLALNGLPQPYHALFNVPQFQLASRDRFFICIESADPKFDLVLTRQFLESLRPVSVAEVPP
jgi:hypothetical protein